MWLEQTNLMPNCSFKKNPDKNKMHAFEKSQCYDDCNMFSLVEWESWIATSMQCLSDAAESTGSRLASFFQQVELKAWGEN